MRNYPKNIGLSMLEILLSLFIIGVILVMGTRYYGITRLAQQTNQAAEMVVAVYSAGQAWLQNEADFSAVNKITVFTDKGMLPSKFANDNANPWGGAITAKVAGNPLQLQVTLDNMPEKACQNLLAKVTNQLSVDPAQTKCGSIGLNNGLTTFTAVLVFTSSS